MTVTATNSSSGPYTGNGAQTAFPFTFRAETTGEVYLEVNGAQAPATITLNTDVNGKLTGGGTATAATAPPNGATVYVRMNPSFQQNISLTNNGAFSPSVIEEGFDRAAERSIYLLGLYNTVVALANAATAAVAGAVAAAVAAAQATINAAVFVVTSATGQRVSTRTLLAGISSPVNGQGAYLSEALRRGWWEWKTGDYSALIAADPYQGMYVQHSTIAATVGAWVRDINSGEIHTEWFDPGALGNNAHLALNTIDALIPASGCHVIFPPNTTYVLSGRVLFTKDGVVIRGAGYSSWLQTNTAAANFHALWVAGDHCKVQNLRISGKETSLFSGNPACLIAESQYGLGGPAGTIAQRTLDDIEISGCIIDNCSVGIIVTASPDTDGARNNGVIVVPSISAKVHHNIITTNMHGMEVFGTDNGLFHHNEIKPSPNAAAAQFSGCFRILGSQECDFDTNKLTGLGYDRSDRTAFRLSAADFAAGARRANKNIRIRNNEATNCTSFVWADECAETLLIEGNNWKEGRAATTDNYAIYLNLTGIADGLLPVVDRVFVRGNVFEGVKNYMFYTSAGGSSKHIQSRDNTIVGNAASIAATGRILNATFPGGKLYEFIRDTFLMNDGGGLEFAFKNATGLRLRVVGCTLPETAGATTMFDNDGTGTLVKTLGNTGEDATLGSNNRFAAGTFALTA